MAASPSAWPSCSSCDTESSSVTSAYSSGNCCSQTAISEEIVCTLSQHCLCNSSVKLQVKNKTSPATLRPLLWGWWLFFNPRPICLSVKVHFSTFIWLRSHIKSYSIKIAYARCNFNSTLECGDACHPTDWRFSFLADTQNTNMHCVNVVPAWFFSTLSYATLIDPLKVNQTYLNYISNSL